MQICTRLQWRNAKVKSDGSGLKGLTPCTCLCYRCCSLEQGYGAPFVKILYLTDLAQKLLSLRIFTYLCTEIAISAYI